jgi:hypothetical protein
MQGDSPHIIRGGIVDPKRLFYSNVESALILPVTIPPGYGILPAGTVMGQILAGTRTGQYVPVTQRVPAAGLNTLFGAAYLLADGDVNPIAQVTMNDSYKFAVGDLGFAIDGNTAAGVDLGAVTAIDRTTNSHFATVTFTNNITNVITVNQGGLVAIQTQIISDWQTAAGILIGSVDTGVGVDAQGGHGAIVFSNAILYNGCLYNCDAGAVIELAAVVSGQHLIMR